MLSAHLRNISRVIKIPGPFRVGNARVHLSIFKEFPRKRLLHQPDHSLIRLDDNSRADAAPIVNDAVGPRPVRTGGEIHGALHLAVELLHAVGAHGGDRLHVRHVILGGPPAA